MDFDEQAAKAILSARGIPIPRSRPASTLDEVEAAAHALGTSVVIKPLLAAGRRGKAGLIRFAEDPNGARRQAEDLFSHSSRVLVEERIAIEQELYLAVMTDRSAKRPRILYSPQGGIDVEEAHEVIARAVDIRHALDERTLSAFPQAVRPVLRALYQSYREHDAELFEINPLARSEDGRLIALDAKLSVDDSALARHPELTQPRPAGTELEERARRAGLYYIELDGDVGVLANGAGLTMATLDAVRFYGGRPANFMEIGGDAYKKGEEALAIVLGNHRVKSLLVNLCGAYARTDVMIEGFLKGWTALAPELPLSFSIHGTGEDRAIELVRSTLGIEPFDEMDDAVRDAIRHTELS